MLRGSNQISICGLFVFPRDVARGTKSSLELFALPDDFARCSSLDQISMAMSR